MILRSINHGNIKSLRLNNTSNNFQKREISLSTLKFIGKYKTLKKIVSLPLIRKYVLKPPKPPAPEKMKTSMCDIYIHSI